MAGLGRIAEVGICFLVAGCFAAREEVPHVARCTSEGCVCVDGYASCNGSDADGCETALSSDPASCGACGHDCKGGSCLDGVCQPVVLFDAIAANLGEPPRMVLLDAWIFVMGAEGIARARRKDAAPRSGELFIAAKGISAIAAAAGCLFWSEGTRVCRACGAELDGARPPSPRCLQPCKATCAGPCPSPLASLDLAVAETGAGVGIFTLSGAEDLLCHVAGALDGFGDCEQATCTSLAAIERTCPEGGAAATLTNRVSRIAATPTGDALLATSGPDASGGPVLRWDLSANGCATTDCSTGICATGVPLVTDGQAYALRVLDPLVPVFHRLLRLDGLPGESGGGVEIGCRKQVAEVALGGGSLYYTTLGGQLGRLPLEPTPSDAAASSCEGLLPSELVFRDDDAFTSIVVDEEVIFFVDVGHRELLRIAR
jgi:hypothetical protein